MRLHAVRQFSVGMIAVLGFAGCSSAGSGSTPTATVTTVAPASAAATVGPAVPSAVRLVDVTTAEALSIDPSVTVIDVRTPAEFTDGHIARAQVVDVTDPSFAARIAELDRSATYLVYCHSGNRSGRATAVMAQLGFTHVNDLDGGISAWQAAGGPVVT